MVRTAFDVRCVWGGVLTGYLMKSDQPTTSITTKIVAVHGWLDNLNSMLPLVEKLIEHHPDFEIYLYDKAGHGFSSHYPETIPYEAGSHVRDLREIVQALGWQREPCSLIGHSYGAMISTVYAACYPEQVSWVVAIDALPRVEAPTKIFWKIHGTRVDARLQLQAEFGSRVFQKELTMEKIFELTISTRPGLRDVDAQLLVERSIRRDSNNKLHFTRDESLKILSLQPSMETMIENLVRNIRAAVFFIGATNPQWPRADETIEYLQKHNSRFEMILIDGPHHLHMTHLNEVCEQIDEFLKKYLSPSTNAPNPLSSQL